MSTRFNRLVLSVLILLVMVLFSFSIVSRSLLYRLTSLTPPAGLKPGDVWPSWLVCQADSGWYIRSGGTYCYSYWESNRVFASSSDGVTVSHSSILDPTMTLGDLEIMWGEPDRATYNQWWTEVFWSGFRMAYTESTNPESKVFLVSFNLSDRYPSGEKWRGHVRNR